LLLDLHLCLQSLQFQLVLKCPLNLLLVLLQFDESLLLLQQELLLLQRMLNHRTDDLFDRNRLRLQV
jgi:hypothetical protein